MRYLFLQKFILFPVYSKQIAKLWTNCNWPLFSIERGIRIVRVDFSHSIEMLSHWPCASHKKHIWIHLQSSQINWLNRELLVCNTWFNSWNRCARQQMACWHSEMLSRVLKNLNLSSDRNINGIIVNVFKPNAEIVCIKFYVGSKLSRTRVG